MRWRRQVPIQGKKPPLFLFIISDASRSVACHDSWTKSVRVEETKEAPRKTSQQGDTISKVDVTSVVFGKNKNCNPNPDCFIFHRLMEGFPGTESLWSLGVKLKHTSIAQLFNCFSWTSYTQASCLNQKSNRVFTHIHHAPIPSISQRQKKCFRPSGNCSRYLHISHFSHDAMRYPTVLASSVGCLQRERGRPPTTHAWDTSTEVANPTFKAFLTGVHRTTGRISRNFLY